MMPWDSLPLVRPRTQVIQASPWPPARRTSLRFWAGDLSLLLIVSNDYVAMKIRETDRRSSVEAGGLFSNMGLLSLAPS